MAKPKSPKNISMKAVAKKATEILQERGYREVAAVGGQFNDWPIETWSEDSSVWQNIFLLRARTRDLFRANGIMSAYREQLWSNVFGENGIAMRMKAKVNEDRPVSKSEEKWALLVHHRRMERILDWIASKTQRRIHELAKRRTRIADLEQDRAKLQVGELDVYANEMIEKAWADWKRAENADVCQRRSYIDIQQLRLLSAVRDGDFFLRPIQDLSVNKFGFALQMVNSEWCDHFYNDILDNGNEVRMGIEYERTKWGIRRPVAYYFLRRQPADWQFSVPGAFNFASKNLHDRIDAAEIIHYARYVDADSTRPAPWVANVIPKSRQQDQFELAEVIAARASACKTGWLTSNLVPEGGGDFVKPDPQGVRNLQTEPSGVYGLPWGIDYKESNPTHPNGNAADFRKMMLRTMCAGMPGANYNIIGKDAEGVSYSTGRIFSLDDREQWKLIQRFDIERAERPIFEKWLPMAILSKQVPLSFAKWQQYNAPHFAGRRWSWVDPTKDAIASKEQLLLGLTSRSRLCDEQGVDFDAILMEIAEEEMMIDDLNLNAISLETIASGGANMAAPEPDGDEGEKPPKEPNPKNGKHHDRFDLTASFAT